MATLSLNPEARAKYLASKKVQEQPKVAEKKPEKTGPSGHEIQILEQLKAQENIVKAKKWLDDTFPSLLLDKSIPYEIGLFKRIRDMKPESIPTSSLHHWINAHCRNEVYKSAANEALLGIKSRARLEEFM